MNFPAGYVDPRFGEFAQITGAAHLKAPVFNDDLSEKCVESAGAAAH